MQTWSEYVARSFPIENEEYLALEHEFGRLTKFAAHQLLRKNTSNNHTDDFEDINQELLIAMIRAGCYHKRQVYIRDCLAAAKRFARDSFVIVILEELENLWVNRTRHGANKQKFGRFQEELLERIVQRVVPKSKRPDKKRPLEMDAEFTGYCKTITWNDQKRMGRKITREKPLRTGQVSLSEHSNIL